MTGRFQDATRGRRGSVGYLGEKRSEGGGDERAVDPATRVGPGGA